jgi:hypothetical protein
MALRLQRVKDLSLSLQDYDHSPLSRDLIQSFTSTTALPLFP